MAGTPAARRQLSKYHWCITSDKDGFASRVSWRGGGGRHPKQRDGSLDLLLEPTSTDTIEWHASIAEYAAYSLFSCVHMKCWKRASRLHAHLDDNWTVQSISIQSQHTR